MSATTRLHAAALRRQVRALYNLAGRASCVACGRPVPHHTDGMLDRCAEAARFQRGAYDNQAARDAENGTAK